MAIPSIAKKASSGSAASILGDCAKGTYGQKLTTLFWFPSEDPELPPAILRDLGPRPVVADQNNRRLLQAFIGRDLATILPFLSSIRIVSVYDRTTPICSVRRTPNASTQPSAHVDIVTEGAGLKSSRRTFFILRESYPIPPQLKQVPDAPAALKRMERAKVALAVALGPEPVPDDDAVFHVYFPTDQRTGLGFTAHADFYVKPDRTRLMPGDYNLWLLGRIAKLAATRLVDELLKHHRPATVYEAMAPTTPSQPSDIAGTFVRLLGEALRGRDTPFVTTPLGLLRPAEVAIPPTVDDAGFWNGHFATVLPTVLAGKRGFLTPTEDTRRARSFLSLAGLEPLSPSTLLNLLEAASQQPHPAQWWYESYARLAHDPFFAVKGHDAFVGRRILLAGGQVMPIPKTSDIVVTLPPTGAAGDLPLPRSFADVFVLLNRGLAELLTSGPDTVEHWVLSRFGISRFEATELLPRAIRRVAPQIFEGTLRQTQEELADIWIFIRQAVKLSRRIESSEFWEDVGRLPIPITPTIAEDLPFAPAFLAYWPDELLPTANPLVGVPGLRRLHAAFIHTLVARSGATANEWWEFLEQAGVSDRVKLLRFARTVPETGAQVEPDGTVTLGSRMFRGERQADENLAVASALRASALWDGRPPTCGHTAQRVLQSLMILDAFAACAAKAADEFGSGESNWQQRLWLLIRSLPIAEPQGLLPATILCRGGSPQGHAIQIDQPRTRQLSRCHWLPSSLGPVGTSVAFARLATRRLIGSGQTEEELGDALLPYVVASTAADLERLRLLGVDVLDDAASARPQALIRALSFLGHTLTSEPARSKVLDQPGRRRLLRGAIQEIYRVLNQAPDIPPLPDLDLAIRTTAGIRFTRGPFYYADPGSPVERAFMDRLALIDVDRPYLRLFGALPVTRLTIGQTVDETLTESDLATPMANLQRELVEDLGPFLLSILLVRTDLEHTKLVIRRLKERIQVFALPRLTVTLALKASPEIRVDSNFPHVYVRKHLAPARGAVEEAHYTMYLVAKPDVTLASLDGDAIGDALARIFLDGVTDEMAGIFPRIVTRYQALHGNRSALEQFLLEHLGVSTEAQEESRLLLTGEELQTAVAPPPALVVNAPINGPHQPADLASLLVQHQEILQKQVQALAQALLPDGDQRSGQKSRAGSGGPPSQAQPHITPEQELRGRRGEDEILRRLQLPGGWEGFVFLEDHRSPARGYDFLASLGADIVKLEVKTFTAGGHIVVTEGELRAAAASRSTYQLIGVLDDGGRPDTWTTIIVPDPLDRLLREGQFTVKADLHLTAAALLRLGQR